MVEEENKETEVVETKENVQKQETPPKNGLVIAGLILGIIGIILSFIPIVNSFSYILGVLAIIFAIIGLVKMKKKTLAIVALILGVLSIVLPILINMYIVKKATNFINDAFTEAIKETEKNITQSETPKELDEDKTEVKTEDEIPKDSDGVRIQGETFIFNNFEITISKDYTFDVVKKEGSYYGTESIVLPATFKNLKENESNWFSYSEYRVTGSKGLRVESLCDFFDNSVDYAKELRPGESHTVNFYFTYDGDGRYSIDFGLLSAEKIYEFDVKK